MNSVLSEERRKLEKCVGSASKAIVGGTEFRVGSSSEGCRKWHVESPIPPAFGAALSLRADAVRRRAVTKEDDMRKQHPTDQAVPMQ